MSKVWINKSTLTDIANAIRSKKGSSALIDPSNFAEEIQGISGGSSIANSFTVNFYDVDKNLVEAHTAKCGNLIGSPLSIVGGRWTDSEGNNIVFPMTSNITVAMNLYFVESAILNSFYEYFGVDKIEYPYFHITSWYTSNQWMIKPIFFKSISSDGIRFYNCLVMSLNENGYGGRYIKSITSEEYETNNYSDISLIYDALTEGGATVDKLYDKLDTDNDTNKCWYFGNYDNVYHTNWTDLRTL